jgi:hypothetical protein
VLIDDILFKIGSIGESEFSIQELLIDKWDRYSNEEKRSCGRRIYNLIHKGQMNKDGWKIEELSYTNPQRYKKQREETLLQKRVFLNDNSIKNKGVRDCIKHYDAIGKLLEIVDKPNAKQREETLLQKRVFLNDISIENKGVRDCIKYYDAIGKWLEIVDKPDKKH